MLGWPTVLPHNRRSMQKLWRIHLAMLIHRDKGVTVRIRISVRVRVNPVQITARYSHSGRKTNPNPNTKLNPNPINTCARIGPIPVKQTLAINSNLDPDANPNVTD